MRRPKYLSPSSISCWVSDPTEFYVKYMSDTPPPRMPQNEHMAIGSSFDAYVKAWLFERLFGQREDMAFGKVFEGQVEPHNRTKEIIDGGKYLFDWYKRLGALDSLMLALGKSSGVPRFELDVRGEMTGGKEGAVRSVPYRVKPDLFFVNEQGASVIFDWKVNGFYSKSGKSPNPGYALLRADGKRPSVHDACRLGTIKGVRVNLNGFAHEEWARQLAIGAWLSGEEVGGEFVGMVHQLVCKPDSPMPRIWVAEHAGLISKGFQEATHLLASEIWEITHSDHIFRHLSPEESAARCSLLDKRKDATDVESVDVPNLEGFSWPK